MGLSVTRWPWRPMFRGFGAAWSAPSAPFLGGGFASQRHSWGRIATVSGWPTPSNGDNLEGASFEVPESGVARSGGPMWPEIERGPSHVRLCIPERHHNPSDLGKVHDQTSSGIVHVLDLPAADQTTHPGGPGG
jgi:hypothetical protein